MISLFEERCATTESVVQDELAVANGLGIIIAVVICFAGASSTGG